MGDPATDDSLAPRAEGGLSPFGSAALILGGMATIIFGGAAALYWVAPDLVGNLVRSEADTGGLGGILSAVQIVAFLGLAGGILWVSRRVR